MKHLVIYTAVVGGYDKLRAVPDPRPPFTDFVCFSDEDLKVEGWEVRRLKRKFPEDPTRDSRRPKLNPHLFVPGYQCSIWHDANFSFLRNPAELFGYFREDLAFFAHPDRACVYAELKACLKLKKDDPAKMQAQIARYEAAGYPHSAGLWMGGVILRRHTGATLRFDEAWWKEVADGSRRDQLSLPFVRWRQSLPLGTLDQQILSRYFARRVHGR